jgi:menaquinone-dependent protoporphyrinogen IX oxidase
MRAAITFESIYGNTRAVAEAVAEGLGPIGDVTVVSHHEADPGTMAAADLVVVGAPTHMHSLPTSLSRKMAAHASEEDGVPLDPGATESPGIRAWLSEQSGAGRRAVAFDTRADGRPGLTGSAARGIAKRLRKRGFDVVVEPESFLVEDAEGPLADGELERAREWGSAIAGQVLATTQETAR